MKASSPPNTSNQQPADELLATQQLLRATLDASMDMIQVFQAVRNEQGELVDFTWILNNHTAEKIYGDVVGKSLLQLQPGVVQEGIFAAFKHVVETGLPQQYEKHYVHEQFDGWFFQSVVRLGDGVATTTADITPRKQAEQTLQQSKALLQDVIDAPNIGIAVYKALRNDQGQITDFVHEYINRASLTMLGGEDFTDKFFTDHGENGRLQLPQLIEVIETGRGNDYLRETDFRDRKVWFAITNTPLGSDRLVHTWQDVTQRKQTETEMLRLKEEVAQTATDTYRTLFETIDEGFALLELLVDPHEQVVDLIYREANAAFEQHTGLAEPTGKLASEIFPQTEPGWLAALSRVHQTGVAERTEGFNSDTQRWLTAHYSRVGKVGSPFIAAVFQDITERKLREDATALLAQIGNDLSVLSAPDAIMQTVGERLGGFFGAAACIFADVDEAANQATIHHGWNIEGVSSLKQTFRLAEYFGDEFRRAGRAGEASIVADTGHDPRANAEAYAALGIGSFVTIPFKRNGCWVANITVTSRQPRPWRADEIELLQDIANRVFPRIERARAEEALRESEKKYRMLFENMGQGYAMGEVIRDGEGVAIDLRYLELNPAFERLSGIPVAQAQGRTVREVYGTVEPEWFEVADRVARLKVPERVEYEIGAIGRWFQMHFYPAEGDRYLGLYEDITDRKRQEQRQAFMLTLSDALRPLTDPAAIQSATTRLLRAHFDTARSYCMEIDEENHRAYMRAENRREATPSAIGVYDLQLFGGVIAQIRTGKPLIINDWDERTKADMKLGSQATEAMNQRQIVAQIAVPIIKHGQLVGTLTVNDNRPRAWTETDVELVVETAERTWAAVEQAKAEEALRQSQKRFESIANLVPDLLWDSEPDGSTNWYNQRWLDYTGQPVEEAIGWGWTDAIHPDDRAASKRRYEEAVAAGTFLHQEQRIRRYDGVYRWFVVSTAPVKDPTGHVIKMYGAATDITDHRLAQQAIQQSEQQLAELRHLTLLRQTEALARMGSWEYHRQSGQFTWSAGMYQLTQVDPQRVLSPEIYRELAIEEDQDRALELIGYLRAGQGHFENQLRIQAGDAVKTLRIKADVIGEGKETRVVGVDMDLTQQLLAQQRIRETAESLQAVLDSSPASIGLLKAQRDERGRLVDFRLAVGNEKLAQFLDEPLDRLLGQPAQRFGALLWDGDTLARLRHIFNTQQGHYEEKPLRPPHQNTWVALSVTRQDDGVVLTVLDITVLKAMQAQQQHWLSELESSRHSVEALAQLKTALQHRSESLRAVSHDLKSNFGIITGSLSLLELAESEAEREQFVSMALRNVQQATGLLSELLDLTRLESSEQLRQLAPQNVGAMFGELGENLTPLAHQQGLALRFSGPELLEVDTDELLLYRLVQNLVMNALKYTHQGGVEVAWGREPGENQWWFVVADTGSGLAAHLVERLNASDPRQAAPSEADPTRSIGSTEPSAKESWASLRGEGIGLRIVREITQLLEVQLRVSSTIGSGTRFVVQLPVHYSAS